MFEQDCTWIKDQGQGVWKNCTFCLNSRPGLLIELILCAHAIHSAVLQVMHAHCTDAGQKEVLCWLQPSFSVAWCYCQQAKSDMKNDPEMKGERCFEGISQPNTLQQHCTSGNGRFFLMPLTNISKNGMTNRMNSETPFQAALCYCRVRRSILWCTVVIITADNKHTILSHEVYRFV